MNKLGVVISLIVATTAVAANKKFSPVKGVGESQEERVSRAKSCLAAFYVAEKSYFSEHKKYSESLEEIGLHGENCTEKEVSIRVWNDGFRGEYKAGNQFWSMDDKKVLTNESK